MSEVTKLFSQEQVKPNIKEGWQNARITHAAAVIIVHALGRRKVKHKRGAYHLTGWMEPGKLID